MYKEEWSEIRRRGCQLQYFAAHVHSQNSLALRYDLYAEFYSV